MIFFDDLCLITYVSSLCFVEKIPTVARHLFCKFTLFSFLKFEPNFHVQLWINVVLNFEINSKMHQKLIKNSHLLTCGKGLLFMFASSTIIFSATNTEIFSR